MNDKNLRTAEKEYATKFAAYRKAIQSPKSTEADLLLAKAKLTVAEKNYATQRALSVYDELAKASEPLFAAIQMWHYDIAAHREKHNEDGKLIDVEVETKQVQIDLLKFCKAKGLPTEWYHSVECLNYLMCIATAEKIGKSKTEVDKIRATYKMKTASKALVESVSKNEIERNLQAIIDQLVFNAGENGANTYKVYNKDVKYLQMTYTKKGKGLILNTAGHRDFTKTIVNIAHRIITDGADYDIGYRRIKLKAEEIKEEKTLEEELGLKSAEETAPEAEAPVEE